MEGGGMLQAPVELTFATKPLVSTGSKLVKSPHNTKTQICNHKCGTIYG